MAKCEAWPIALPGRACRWSRTRRSSPVSCATFWRTTASKWSGPPHRNHPDIVVVDVKLKQGDGIETAKEMVREGVGVLFLTGHGWRRVADSGLPSGVVEKPFCPEIIVRAVRAIGHMAPTGEVPS